LKLDHGVSSALPDDPMDAREELEMPQVPHVRRNA
jgi:hypothetical protein